MAMRECPHIVICQRRIRRVVCARALNHAALQLIVIDRHNYHPFQPLLYQVATAGLSPSDIAYPIRCLLRGQNNSNYIL